MDGNGCVGDAVWLRGHSMGQDKFRFLSAALLVEMRALFHYCSHAESSFVKFSV